MSISRLTCIGLMFAALTSGCGKEEKDPHGKLPQPKADNATPAARMPTRDPSANTPTPTPTDPMPNRNKVALFFQPGSFSGLENCMQQAALSQAPAQLVSATIRGPLTLTQDANGKKSTASARIDGKDAEEKAFSYTLVFRTPDPAGWSKQIRNLYIGAVGYGIDSSVTAISTDAESFTLDIASCLEKP